MSWPIPVMQPVPFHLLTAIFVGWLEPNVAGQRMIMLADHEADEFTLFNSDGVARSTPDIELVTRELIDLSWDLQIVGYGYGAGAMIEGYLQPRTPLKDPRFLVRHVMPVDIVGARHDALPLCVRRCDMVAALTERSFRYIEPIQQIPIMTAHGVLDEQKLDNVARDLGVSGLTLCNNYSHWQVDVPPNSITGRNDPGWTTWLRPNTKT